MLVVDAHALRAVDFLDAVHQVLLHRLLAFDFEELLRVDVAHHIAELKLRVHVGTVEVVAAHFQTIAMGLSDIEMVAVVNKVARFCGFHNHERHLRVACHLCPVDIPLVVTDVDAGPAWAAGYHNPPVVEKRGLLKVGARTVGVGCVVRGGNLGELDGLRQFRLLALLLFLVVRLVAVLKTGIVLGNGNCAYAQQQNQRKDYLRAITVHHY